MQQELDEKTIEEISEVIIELLAKMGFAVKVTPRIVERDNQESACFNVETDEASILIGQGGANLLALQHVARLVVRQKTNKIINFTVDVNNYKEDREKYLNSLALDLARRVRKTGEPVVLKPMNPYERRIIHSALSSEENIETMSEGEDPERRVVIRPISPVKSIEEKIDNEIV